MARKHDPALDVLTSLHKPKYGAWAGRPAGSKPVARQCCHEVRDQTGWLYSQCSRTRGHGPEGATGERK